ncbi:MAG: molybdenum cofactor guanylyltransferase MobA [Hydrogenophaga sp.]|uniref:molybdenum cofactor guanylyltransferase MobA n=1 Tax=Hydrogenophaga sp. TaxID=1904254 RepID=UPI002766189E|nr:molybdenum cofactor guanylyltransferase MobA [Hydrogenophaga sp.]MDP2418313.1 molybdenum cofactor guanylyltransferase MobA [Hydrogenophaga sp.]MDZ4189771.1 molybdenum cofactor guanylyltransferase MobA [Hydrogenophaga sp.]
MIHTHEITAIVLAGGRGSRMGGADKGLQNFHGTPLALHTVMRLQIQEGGLLGELMINANRNLSAYEAFGAPVWPDTLNDYAGPLAGFMTGLERCETPYLLTVPCDTPLFPLDLAQRMAQAFEDETTEIAMAAALEADGQLRAQPVFCLMRVELLESLVAFTQAGGRKIDRWTDQHKTVLVPFNLPSDDARAFCNTNTLAELHALENP